MLRGLTNSASESRFGAPPAERSWRHQSGWSWPREGVVEDHLAADEGRAAGTPLYRQDSYWQGNRSETNLINRKRNASTPTPTCFEHIGIDEFIALFNAKYDMFEQA